MLDVWNTAINCADAYASSQWWCELLGYEHVAGDPNEPGDTECAIVHPTTGHCLLFLQVEHVQDQQGLVHLALASRERTRDEEVDRALEHGATLREDRRNDDGTGWVVLNDPFGVTFCIVRAAHERAD